MRAKEFIVEYKKYPTTEYEGVTFTMMEKDGELIVKALNDFGIAMGHVIFTMDGKELDPQELEVDEKYQGQGIAKVMYDYIKSRGFIINRSWDQTDAGAGFWNKHRGEDVRVWESSNEFSFDTEPYEGWTGEGLIVKAFDGKDEVGHVIFEPTEDDDTQWYAVDVEVEEPYQRRGIATHMYNIAKKAAQAQGKIIVRSHAQSEAGRGLWQDKRVWESSNELVPASQMYAMVQKIHRALDDFSEGDLGDRIYWFDDYKLVNIPISKLNLDEHWVDEDYVEDYMNHIADSKHTMPPIVFDPIAGSIIDGTHRANAYARLGNKTIPAYVGNTKSEYYGQRDSD